MNLVFLILGSALASFALCYYERRAKETSIISPPSSCDFCHKKLKPIDLIPIISYLALRGRCRSCGKKIGPIKFYYEVVGGLLGIISFCTFKDIRAIFILISLVISLNIVTSDLKSLEIYEEDLIGLAIVGLFYRIFFLSFSFDFFRFALGFALGFLILKFISKGSIGDGDLFFYEALFLFLEARLIPSFFLYSIWIGGFLAVIIAIKNRSLKGTLAFCPPIFLAFICCLLVGRIL